MRSRRFRPLFDSLDQRLVLDDSAASTLLGGTATAGTILVAVGQTPPPTYLPGDDVDGDPQVSTTDPTSTG
jgi:hypothetical protein